MSGLGHVLDSEELSGLANELTGGAGIDDGATTVPDSLAADIEEYQAHQAEQGLELEPDDQADDHRPGRKEVPLGALKEERARRQELQAENARLQAEREQLNTQWQQLQQRLAYEQQVAAAQQAEQAIPDFSDDPEGYIKAREAQFSQQLAAVQNQQVQRQQAEHLAAQVTSTVQQIAPELAQTEAAFEAEHPEYREAFDFMDQQADAQLAAAAPQATPAERQLLKVLALTDLAMRAKQAGQNPCALILQQAQQRGFKAGQSGWRQPAAPRQAVKAPTSLGSLHGAVEPGAPQFDLQTIASLSDEAFEQAWAEMSKGAKPRFAF